IWAASKGRPSYLARASINFSSWSHRSGITCFFHLVCVGEAADQLPGGVVFEQEKSVEFDREVARRKTEERLTDVVDFERSAVATDQFHGRTAYCSHMVKRFRTGGCAGRGSWFRGICRRCAPSGRRAWRRWGRGRWRWRVWRHLAER